jgi:ribosomal protein S18 acetylase RimI-like enzyme
LIATTFRKDEITIAQARAMAARDIDAVVALHQIAFPDYFLSLMGKGFLRQYYSEFVSGDTVRGFVVSGADERIVGFAVGVFDSDAFYRQLYRHRFLGLSRAALIALFHRGAPLWRQLLTRVPHIRRALASLAGPRTRPARTQEMGPATRLLAIAVSPDSRGQGVADALVQKLCMALRDVGALTIGLSVKAENGRAIRFYLRTGWTKNYDDGSTLRFVRST